MIFRYQFLSNDYAGHKGPQRFDERRKTGEVLSVCVRIQDLAYHITHSLRADEIKLWLTPSAKQRRNPCSGLPAVYPDLSTRHDWPVKKALFCLS